MGRMAANKALALMNGESLDKPHELIQAQLILRETDSPRG